MTRKPIPEETQKNILMRSRRRCCLCFWLNGTDEVQKGQIAHMDGDNENSNEENLAFLCFDHHDDYDGTTRLAKGLKESEVKQWRDELYKEMQYRFRTVKKRDCVLSVDRLKHLNNTDDFFVVFRVTNTGEDTLRSPTTTIRLQDNICGELPLPTQKLPSGFEIEMPDPWRAIEKRLDIFEPNGRTTIHHFGGINPIVNAGHSYYFQALRFPLERFPFGSTIELQYRIDAEGMLSVSGNVNVTVPQTFEELLTSE